MKSMALRTLFAFILVLPTTEGNEAVGKKPEESLKMAVYSQQCKHGLRYGPEKKFAVYVFCDDAAGTSIGIINTTPGYYVGPGSETAWKLEERFWQEKRWALDVQFIEWSKDGLKLMVFTGAVYGTNKKYVLDLVHKKIESETDSPGWGWAE